MLKKYLLCALVSMVPLIELRGGVPIAVGMGLPYLQALVVCVIANMLPVPVIYFFARKVLEWGKDKKYIGKFFTYCIEKGERGGRTYTSVVLLNREQRKAELARITGGSKVTDALLKSAGELLDEAERYRKGL